MINLAFIFGIIVYTTTVFLLYSETFKASPYYYYIGLLIGFITNSLWLYIAKQSEGSTLYMRGLVWDCIIVGTYVLIPPLFFNIKMNPTAIVGCIFILIGIILTKI